MYAAFTLDQLTAFLAVVDEGSFSAAARRLGRVQSAVSYTIGQLEAALGSTLFDRGGRAPALTDAGRRLVAEARLVVGRSRDLAEVAARLRSGIEPELHVAADALYPEDRLLDACVAFQAQFPSTLLRLEVGLLDDVIDAVAHGVADLGVCNLAGGFSEDLSVTHLGAIAMVPVCAPHHPLAGVPCPQPGAAMERSVQIVHTQRRARTTKDQGVLASRTWRVTEMATKVELIRRGVGWGSLPTEVAEAGVRAGVFVRLWPAPWPVEGHHVELHAAVRRDHPLGRAGQWFREQLRLPTGRRPAISPAAEVP